MKKVILYGSAHCPSCSPAKEYLEKRNVTFGFVDITSGMGHLKRFLKLRDVNPKYNEVKSKNQVGIPTLVIDGEPFILEGDAYIEELIKKYKLAE